MKGKKKSRALRRRHQRPKDSHLSCTSFFTLLTPCPLENFRKLSRFAKGMKFMAIISYLRRTHTHSDFSDTLFNQNLASKASIAPNWEAV